MERWKSGLLPLMTDPYNVNWDTNMYNKNKGNKKQVKS